MTSTTPIPERPVLVGASDRWTDEWFPTCRRSASPREAATAVLEGMEWGSVGREPWGDHWDADPLVYHGTVAWLRDVVHLRRTENRLLAWLTSRMRTVSMCCTDGHENDDGSRWFNDCWAGDPDDDPCTWEHYWTVDATGREFWRFAQYVAREED